MKLKFRPYTLKLKHTFTLANNSRNTTDVMLTKIHHENHIGFGEASMPPYLGETHKSVGEFLSKVKLEQFTNPLDIKEIMDYVDNIAPGNNAAKASVDIALHDLCGKMYNKPLYEYWDLDKTQTPETSFTIGIDEESVIRQKISEAEKYNILKVKLGSENDKKLIEIINSATDKPIIADVNQGWQDKDFALDMIKFLAGKNIRLIEQPLPKEFIDETAWLTENSPLPIFADESVKRLSDLEAIKGVYSGVNIKLMKSTGLQEAYKMIKYAKGNNIQVMLGCMTETSCAVSAAAQLSPLADWADLDGNLLITNDPYKGIEIINGKIELNKFPGIGIREIRN